MGKRTSVFGGQVYSGRAFSFVGPGRPCREMPRWVGAPDLGLGPAQPLHSGQSSKEGLARTVTRGCGGMTEGRDDCTESSPTHLSLNTYEWPLHPNLQQTGQLCKLGDFAPSCR